MDLVIATRNTRKLDEVRALFTLPGLSVSSVADYPDVPEVVEDGDTFEANAAKKALGVSRATGHWALADDSGLEVEALDLAPGVYSARYAGEDATDQENNLKLLRELSGHDNRKARFRCSIALASPEGEVRTVSGACEGTILSVPRGTAGFGYDPLFLPRGCTETFAEMSAERKNGMSHRGRALAKARVRWASWLSG